MHYPRPFLPSYTSNSPDYYQVVQRDDAWRIAGGKKARYSMDCGLPESTPGEIAFVGEKRQLIAGSPAIPGDPSVGTEQSEGDDSEDQGGAASYFEVLN